MLRLFKNLWGYVKPDAIVDHYLVHNLDRGNCSARLFFADFRKAFDLIDHNILLHKLSGFDVHNALLRWVAAFLEGRTQFISLMDAASTARVLNGGVPQGTRLGPLLFSIMVNDLVSSWVPRAKYVDDLTVLEVVQETPLLCQISLSTKLSHTRSQITWLS